MLYPHKFWPRLEREQRLCFKHGPQEAPTESPRKVATDIFLQRINVSDPTIDVDDVFSSLDEKDRAEIIRGIENATNVNPREIVRRTRNLEAAVTSNLAKENLALLRAEINEQLGPRDTESSESPKEKTTNPEERSGLMKTIDWTVKHPVESAGIAVAAAAGVYLMTKFVRWLFKKEKQGEELVKQAAKKTVSGFWWGLGGIAVGIGAVSAYIGLSKFSWFSDAFKVKEKITETGEKIVEAGEEVIADGREVVENAAAATGTAANNARESLPNPTLQDAREGIGDFIEEQRMNIISGSAALFLKVYLDNPETPNVYAALQTENMGAIIDSYAPSTDGQAEGTVDFNKLPRLLSFIEQRNPADRERYLQAARGLVKLCHDREADYIASHGGNEAAAKQHFRSLTLAAFIEEMSQSMSPVQDAIRAISETGDIKNWDQSKSMAALLSSSSSVAGVLPDYFVERYEALPEDLRKVELADAFAYIASDTKFGERSIEDVLHEYDENYLTRRKQELETATNVGLTQSEKAERASELAGVKKRLGELEAQRVRKQELVEQEKSKSAELEKVKAELAAQVKSESEWEALSPEEQRQITLEHDKLKQRQLTLEAELVPIAQELQSIRARELIVYIIRDMLLTGEQLAPLFHEVLPNQAWDNVDDEKNWQAIEALKQKLSINDALYLHSNHTMLRSKHKHERVSGLVSLQFQILKLIEQEDNGTNIFGYQAEWFRTRQKQAAFGLAMNLNNPEFREALMTGLGVSAAVIGEAIGFLWQPSTQLAEQAGEGALGPINSVAETGVAGYLRLWKDYPIATALGTTAAGGLFGWKLSFPARWFWRWRVDRTDPKLLYERLESTKNRLWRRIYSGLRNEYASMELRRAAGTQLNSIHSANRSLGGNLEIQGRRNLIRWLRAGADPSDLKKFYCEPLNTELSTVKSEIKTIQSGPHPLTRAKADKLAALQKAETNITRALSSADDFMRPENVSAQRALRNFVRPIRYRIGAAIRGMPGRMPGVGIHALFAYLDWNEWADQADMKKETLSSAREAVRSVRQSFAELKERMDNDPRFERKTGTDTYVHKISKVEVDLRIPVEKLKMIENAQDEQLWADSMKFSSSVLFTGLWMSRLVAGPAGWIWLGVEIIVRTAISTEEEVDMRKFITDCPAWLLAALGTSATTGNSEYNWLRKANSWMLSDFWWDGVENSVDKPIIAKKVLFSIFNAHLQQKAPHLLGEIYDGYQTPDYIENFYEGEFVDVFMPLLSLKLHQKFPDKMSWANAKALDIDSGGIVIPARVSVKEIREAMSVATIDYMQHLRESRAIEIARLKKSLVEADEDLTQMAAAEILQEVYGKELAFGEAVSELNLDVEGGKTRMQRMIEAAYENLDMGASPEQAFSFAANEIPGLSSSLSWNEYATYSWESDPVTRERLRTVIPETTAEAEARVYANSTIENILTKEFWALPDGIDEGASYLLYLHAANSVLRRLEGDREISEGVSAQAARRALTEGAIDYMQKVAKDNEGRSFGKYIDSYEPYRSGSHMPLVFSRIRGRSNIGDSYDNLFRLQDLLSQPNAREAEFDFDKVLAVFFEGQDMNPGQVVLATFVYGDPEGLDKDPPHIYVVQRGASVAHNSTTTSWKQGHNRVMGGAQFMQQTGAKDMIETIKQGISDRAAEQERRRIASLSREEKVQHEWESKIAERDTTEREQKAVHEAALERAKQSSYPIYVPPLYVRDESRRIFYLPQQGTFRANYEGYDIVLNVPRMLDGPAFAAGSSEWNKAVEEHHKLEMKAVFEGTNYTYRASLYGLHNSENFTQADRAMLEHVLTTPIDLSNHPMGDNERYVNHIREYELRRLLDMVAFDGSTSWNGVRVQGYLFQGLLPKYKEAEGKGSFLQTVFDELSKHDKMNYRRSRALINKM